jgi:hypothetical protein
VSAKHRGCNTRPGDARCAALTVRLDIRPRLVLRDEPPRAARRRRLRLPPLAVPAVGYWLGMAALTYFFATLGPYPLDPIEPAEASTRAPLEAPPPPMPLEPPAPSALPPPAAALPGTVPPEPVAPAPMETAPAPPAPQAPDAPLLASEPRRPAPQPPSAAEDSAPRVPLSFPEFTDSSRPSLRERASDGPRIDSLFDRADAPPAKDAPSSAQITPPPEKSKAARPLLSCEAAVARNNEQLTLGGPRGPTDISREQYAGILQNGNYLGACSPPERTVVEICAAIRDGQAVGITVVSNPPNSSLNACVRSAVSRLKFPVNPRLDVTHTRFDAVRR